MSWKQAFPRPTQWAAGALIGLQLPEVVRELGSTTLLEAIGYGAVISAVAIVMRLVWTFPAAFLPSFLPWRPKPRRLPDWRMVMLVAWAGMRGVVSLASALAIPVEAAPGVPFPLRAQILFVTFVVILITLVGQGLSLPFLVRRCASTWQATRAPSAELERRLRELVSSPCEVRGVTPPHELSTPSRHQHDELRLELVRAQRSELLRLRNEGEVGHELARTLELELDLLVTRLESRLGSSAH